MTEKDKDKGLTRRDFLKTSGIATGTLIGGGLIGGLIGYNANKEVDTRKWSYLVISVLSALITPPDFITQLIVLIPMAVLYEASIYIVKRMEARQVAAQQGEIVSTETPGL